MWTVQDESAWSRVLRDVTEWVIRDVSKNRMSTPNEKEDGSESLCIEVGKAQRCHVWVELRCTWLEP